MTTTPPDDGPDPLGTTRTAVDDGPRVTREEVRDLGRLRRTTGPHRTIAGVAGGLGRHLDVDPVILRVAFVVLAFFGGAGVLLYGACWLLVPDDRSTTAPLGLDERSRTVGLVIAGAVAAAALLGTSLGDGFVPFPLVVVAGVVLLVVLQVNKKKETEVATGPVSGPVPGPVTLTKPPVWTPPAVPVEPRRRGPVLFWFTLALCALGTGLLGVVDLAGAGVPAPAYPALVVGLVGAMLVLGAFWGRAGGLVLVGLVATLALVGSIAVQEVDGVRVRTTPTSAADVRTSYGIDVGELVLDLRDVQDPQLLVGRTIRLTGDVGRIEVVVPDGIDVAAAGTVDGPGEVRVLGRSEDGLDPSLSTGAPGSTAVLTVEATLDVGSIDIHTPEG